MSKPIKAAIAEDLFAEDTEVRVLMRSLDWSKTPIGPVEQWPQSLRTSVSICLNSRFPIILWWGPQQVILYNDAYRPILGATKHPQAMGQPGRECWPEIWDIIGPMLDGVLTTGKATWSDDQLLLLYRNGFVEECYFTFSYSPILDEMGNVGGVFTAVTETTKRVLSERRLRILRELAAKTAEAKTVEEACAISTQTLAEHSADIPFAGLYLIDEEGQQAELKGVTGIEANPAIAPEVVDLRESANDSETWPLIKAIRTGAAQGIENVAARLGEAAELKGRDCHREALILPIASPEREHPAGVLLLGISPKLLLDEEYRGFCDLIVSHVSTAIANVRAYEQERKRAEALAELDQAKTAFFSNVSHEFRTPLTLMLGPIEEISLDASNSLAPGDREQLHRVHRNGLRLLKLVNTLLDFSRIEAGRIQAVYELTDLATFTAELASNFRCAIEQAGMRLVVECPPLPEPVYIDCEMWEKIVLNLLSNAFKFTFVGEIAVILKHCETHVQLEVRDTGTGIPAGELPHLFDRFHRVKGSRGRSYEGSGIGLSLVRELVGLHGGTVEVESVLDRGSRFMVSIPTGCAHLPSDRIRATRTEASTGLGADPYVQEALGWFPGAWETGNPAVEETQKHSPLVPLARILLADDNADMRDYIKRLLCDRYEVETVADGVAALAAIADCRPDLVVSDVMMPRLDGFAMLRELRDNPETRDIPIILLSARAGEEARVEGLEAGADDYLIKPFSARELLARIEATLKMSRLRQEAAAREQELRAEADRAREVVTNILESMTDAFFAIDIEGRLSYVNGEAEQILGRSREELLGKNFWEEYPDTVNTQLGRECDRAIAEGVTVSFECYYSPFECWYEVRVYPSQQGLSVYLRDISDRKQTEEALRNSERLYRAIGEMLDYGIWVCDREGRNIYASECFLRLVGLTQEQCSDYGWSKVLHPDDAARTLAAWQECVRTSGTFDMEHRFRGVDGNWYPILARGVPVKNDRGEVIYWAGINLDISRLKHTEQALREHKERLQAALEASETGTYRWDIRTNTVEWDDNIYRLFGIPEGSKVTRFEEFIEQIHPGDRKVVALAVERSVQSGVDFEMGFRVIWPDGSIHWLLDKGKTFFDDRGNPLYMTGACLDMTNSKQTQEALRDAEERLRVALKNSPIVLFNQDRELRYTWLYNQIFQYTINDILGKRDIDLLSSDDAAVFTRIKQQVLKTGVGIREEVKLTLQGKDWYFDLTVEPLWDDNNEVIGVTCAAVDICDRKQAQIALERSETVLNAFLSSSPIGLAFLDRDLRYIHINEALAVINGVPVSAHRDRTLADILPQWAPHLAPIFVRVMETKQPLLNQELCGETYPPGVIRYSLVNYFPVCLPDGELLGVGVSSIDITEVKRAEQALRESEQRFRRMADGAPVYIWMSGTDGHCTYFNEPWLEFVGLTLEEALTKGWPEGIHPDDKQRCLETYMQAFEARIPFEFEYRHRRKDGEYRWLFDTGVPLFHPDGSFLGYIGSGIDISDRKRAEVALRESEQRFRIAQELSLDAFTILQSVRNEAGEIIDFQWRYVNPKAAEILNHSAEELLGGRLLEILPGNQTNSELFDRYVRVVETGEPHDLEVCYQSEEINGWFRNMAVKIGDGIAISFSDITQRKRDEWERIKLLEREREAREQAESANRVKDEFLAVLSHELRSPLNPILGWVKLLRTRKFSEAKTQQALETIERNAKLQIQLIEDLLDVSRILRGKLSLNVSAVDLPSTIEAAIETVRLATEAKSIEIHTIFEPDIGQVLGDCNRLQQVIWNLLSNAVKFTDSGGRVEVRLERSGTQAAIAVSDTGRGIDRDFLPFVFDYFRQADSTTTRVFGGLGLGLAIVRHVVEMHGGTVRAHSPGIGQGATFRVLLPLMNVAACVSADDAPPEDAPNLEGVRILLVDDEADTLDLITFVLQESGASVRAVNSAFEAIEALKHWQPDLLVSDIGMPEMDGYMLIQAIRKMPPERGGNIPAIALTAYAGDGDRQRVLQAGFEIHIPKPVEPTNLTTQISRLIHKNANNFLG